MPLSEDEERILQEIAQRFYEDDPTFAREVSETSLYRHTTRRIKLSIVGIVLGVLLLLMSLSSQIWLAFGGFVVMLVSALVLERNVRKLGKAGIDQISRSVRGAGLRDALGGAGRRMRERYRRKEDDEP